MDLIVPYDVVDLGMEVNHLGGMGTTEFFRGMFIIDTDDHDGQCSWKHQVVAKNASGIEQTITLKRVTQLVWGTGDPSSDVFATENFAQYSIAPNAAFTLQKPVFAPQAGLNRYFWSIPDVVGLSVYTGRPVCTQLGATRSMFWRPLANAVGPGAFNEYIALGPDGGTWIIGPWVGGFGNFYWDASLFKADSLQIVLEAAIASSYGGVLADVQMFDLTANAAVPGSLGTIKSGGSFRYPAGVADRVTFDASKLIDRHLYEFQFRRRSSWGGGYTTEWLTSAFLTRACMFVKAVGVTKCEILYRVAKQTGSEVEAVDSSGRAVIDIPAAAGAKLNYIKTEICSRPDPDFTPAPEEDFWVTDDGTNLSGDGTSAVNVPKSNAHQGPVGALLPIRSADWKDNFVSGHSYCTRTQPTVLGGDANSMWTLVCIGLEAPGAPAPEKILPAYWHGGYFGIETPETMKFFRYGQLLTDNTGFRVMNILIDHIQSTFRNPKRIDFRKIDNAKVSNNIKAKLNQYWIQFPDEDCDANVLELSDSHIKIAER